jgi:hypothetical protein
LDGSTYFSQFPDISRRKRRPSIFAPSAVRLGGVVWHSWH